jgi:biopolymer transport protein ExbD
MELFPIDTSAGRKRARIEIIPLIDVIFFLLATFVLFTLSLNKIQSLPVSVPAVQTGTPPPPDDTAVVLQISEHGTAYWNHELITLADLPGRLLAYKAGTPNPRLLLAGDNRASFGDTVAALDEVRRAGVTQVAIETTDRPTGR